jgi:flavin-dependent dehydrogenase
MNSVDVLIVGGGPAGSSCAWVLTRAGVDSLVLDAEDFPRPKPCAGWITPHVLRLLEIDPASYPFSFLTFPRIHCEYHGRRAVRRFTLRTAQHSIRRVEFDHWLLGRSGARVQKHAVRDIRKDGDGYVIDDRFRCRRLVGAGGTHCPVRRVLFAPAAPRPAALQVATLEEEFSYPARDPDCLLWFGERGLPGYSWFVPKGNGWLNVGLGAFSLRLRAGGPSLRAQWDQFTRGLAERGLVRHHAFSPRGYTYYVRSPVQDVARDGCYLVGDSAGLATRDLGEGIGPAVESGLLAARSILTGAPYVLDGMTKYSYLPPGILSNVAERWVDREGGFFRDRVFGRAPA